MKNKRFSQLVCLTLSLLSLSSSIAQQTVNYSVDFSSGVQNMWGPSFSPFTIDQDIDLFGLPWDLNFNEGYIATVAGQDFGAQMNGHFGGFIGSRVSLHGFTSGTIEVDYPIDITLDMPTDLTYDQGDLVTIATDYVVDPNYELKTNYPSVGEAKLDLLFELSAGLSAKICFFSCVTFPIIPDFNTGLVTLNLATVNENGAWFLGPSDWLGPDGPGVSGFPFSKPFKDPPYTVQPPNFVPWQCYEPAFPFSIPDNPMGLTGEIDVPYVETTDQLNGTDLSACGESTYFNLNLEIFQLLSNWVPALALLNGSQDLGLATISWNFFSASFDMNLTNHQCFDFTPKVWGRYEFPVAVDYQIYDPVSSTYSSQATSSIINVELGKDLRYKYPCYFEDLHITPTYYIDGSFDNIRNHTYDSVSFDFLMSALGFGIEVPAVTVIPGFTIPEICVTLGYPCGWFDWCTYDLCTPEIVVPPIGLPAIDESFGPLWADSIPLGSFEYDWIDISWNLEGFSEHTMVPFTMKANPLTITHAVTDVACKGGATGAIDVTTNAVSPALPYTYTWTNGANTEDISSLTAGDYELSVIDNNNCQMYTGIAVLEPEFALEASFTTIDKSCNGPVNNGSIDLTVIGGTPPYSYTWNTGATSQDLSGLDAGTYTVTVVDNRGCQINTNVTINQPTVLGQNGIVSNVSCFNGNDGTIAVEAFGGTLPYSYNWSNGQTTATSNNLTAGNYSLTVTDDHGCTSTAPYTVSEPLAPLAISATGVDILCKGGTTGSIDATTSGGTTTYSYSWTNSAGVILPYTSEDLSNVPSGEYFVTVTDSKGCTAQTSQVLNEPTNSLSSNPIITHVNCFADATGSIDPVVAGGTAPYSYSWSNGMTSSTIINVVAGNYSLIVTDNAGCTASFNYVINEPAEGLSLTLSKVDVLCYGNNTGSVSSVVDGGSAPYTYSWSNGGTTGQINGLIAGTYNLIVTDSKGCTINGSETVDQPLAPIALSESSMAVDCFGASTGSIDLTIAGGTSPYSQMWSNSQTFILVDTTEDVNNLPAGTYLVEVTDANGCIDQIYSTVAQPSAPISLSGITDDVNCFGLNDGAIDLTAIGGTPGYTYNWSNASSSEDLSSITAGTYSVTVTDLNGCTELIEFTIIEPQAALAISTFSRDVFCKDGITGFIEAEVIGGTTPYTYSWSNGEAVADIYDLAAGTYTLTVTDAQGCTAFSGAVVNEPAQELTVTPIVLDASCYTYSDGEIVVDVAGGVQPYYFSWGNEDEYLLNNPSETLSGLSANTYFIRVEDANGCINEQNVVVGEPNPVIIETIVNDALCYDEATGSVDLTIIGGTAPYSYDWSNGGTTEDIANILAGEYAYTVTDAQNCVLSGKVYVDQPDEIRIFVQEVPVSCLDQQDGAFFITPYGGTMPYTYLWNDGSMEQNLEGLKPGTYSLIVTDANTCANSFEFVVDENNMECLFIPNTITPNGDEYNDTWIIRNIELYPNASVKVFNRWGNELFSSEGVYKPWDGTAKGEPLPSEVYYYIIVLGNEEANEYTGTITIIR